MQRPLVGVGVLIFRGTRILVGRRKGSHGAGTFALPARSDEGAAKAAAAGSKKGLYGEPEPRLMEPEKCEGWQWAPWGAIPEPVFLPLKHLLQSPYRPL
ncbi:Nudix hydrolase 1 [Tetrabaena socialis]|uniref:Nudix hydrolase 1 n=1 Tax=Tetrabaena socialis TaxID=47790 RepID=A0A2J8AIS1_9CHLO|nr:Nudix hydrolase 1 [Tetrabaena socialis]|eukprot:PNH12414.1 Nudix hydrolase 1 [Tetrabaena socialis]